MQKPAQGLLHIQCLDFHREQRDHGHACGLPQCEEGGEPEGSGCVLEEEALPPWQGTQPEVYHMKRILIAGLIAVLAMSASLPLARAAGPIVIGAPTAGTATLTTGKLTYTQGEPIDWRCGIFNDTDQPLELTFTSSQFYDLILRQGSTVIARWSTGKSFADVMSSVTIMPGETKEYSGSWQVPVDLEEGTYSLEFILTTSAAAGRLTATTQFDIGKAAPWGVGVTFTTDKLIYRVGTKLTVSYTITNLGAEALDLVFPSAQQIDWTVTDAQGNLLYRWSDGKAFAQVVTHVTVPAGGTQTFGGSWDIPRDLKPNGFYIHFTVMSDTLGTLATQRAAVLMGSTPPAAL